VRFNVKERDHYAFNYNHGNTTTPAAPNERHLRKLFLRDGVSHSNHRPKWVQLRNDVRILGGSDLTTVKISQNQRIDLTIVSRSE